ncbi:MAG: hypothetical protein ACXWJ5_15595 [Xanthobacteraceae bacterium]
MRALGVIQQISDKIAEMVETRQRLNEFTCGDCERWEHCGLPPNVECVAKAAQIARNGEKPLRRTHMLGNNAAWIYDR